MYPILLFQKFLKDTMPSNGRTQCAVALISLLFFFSRCIMVESALCKGSVIFYWKEVGTARKENERNYGLLEKEITGSQGRLAKFFEPKDVYAYTVNGNCNWEIYNENFFKGKSLKLRSGFGGIPVGFITNSLKKVPS